MSSTPYSSSNVPMIRSAFPQYSHRPCNWCCRSGDSKRKFQQECAAALPGRGQQANQLSFQRYLGPLDCFQHPQSTEMPNRCPATAQIWHCRIGETPKILWETTEIEYEGKSSQLQQMSIRQRQDMSGKLSNWSSLRRRVCH